MTGKHTSASTNTLAFMRQQPSTMKLLLEVVFSMQFIPRLYKKDQQDRPVSCKSDAIQQGYEHGSRGVSIVGSHYQAVTSEDIGDFVCAAVTVTCRVFRSHATLIVTSGYELEVFSKSSCQSKPCV